MYAFLRNSVRRVFPANCLQLPRPTTAKTKTTMGRQLDKTQKAVAITLLENGHTQKLIEEIKLLWVQRTRIEYLVTLVHSMPRRLQLVIDANGDITKY